MIKSGQFATVVFHDRSTVSGMVGDQDNNTLEVMTMFEGVKHIPWQTIRYIQVGPGDDFVSYDDDDDDPDDDGDDDDPQLVMALDVPKESKETDWPGIPFVVSTPKATFQNYGAWPPFPRSRVDL